MARATFRREIAEYLSALTVADRALVANERQRAAIASLLGLVGRLDPLSPVEEQIVIVSSGSPMAPSTARQAPDERRPVVLWAGGAYPWFQLDNLPEALRRIAINVPDVRFRLVGLRGRDGAVGMNGAHGQQFLDQLACDPLLIGRVDDVPWAPYSERSQQYEGATIAVSCYGRHVETYFSMRTRLLDIVWAGIPLITSGGDELSEQLRQGGAAVISDDGSLAEEVIRLLRDPQRRTAMAESSRALRDGALGQQRTIMPLIALSDDLARAQGEHGRLAVLRVPSVSGRRVRETAERLAHRLFLRKEPRA